MASFEPSPIRQPPTSDARGQFLKCIHRLITLTNKLYQITISTEPEEDAKTTVIKTAKEAADYLKQFQNLSHRMKGIDANYARSDASRLETNLRQTTIRIIQRSRERLFATASVATPDSSQILDVSMRRVFIIAKQLVALVKGEDKKDEESLTANSARKQGGLRKSRGRSSNVTMRTSINPTRASKVVPNPQTEEEKQKDADKRKQILSELLKTETTYFNDLTLLRELYYLPLKAAKHFPGVGPRSISDDTVETIFYGFEPIYSLNKGLLYDMSAAHSDHDLEKRVPAIFARYVPSMKLYIDYVNHFDRADAALGQSLTKNTFFRDFIANSKREPRAKKKDIKDFLIQPVQRIPRYTLLLQEILKHTPKPSEHHTALENAFSAVSEIAEYINEKKREHDAKEMVQSIYERFVPKTKSFLNLGRYYISEAQFFMNSKVVKEIKGNKKRKKHNLDEFSECTLILFNDLIVWGTRRGKDLLVEKSRLALHNMKETSALNTRTNKDYMHGLCLSNFSGHAVEVFHTPNKKLRDEWIGTISTQKVLYDTQQKLNHTKRTNLAKSFNQPKKRQIKSIVPVENNTVA